LKLVKKRILDFLMYLDPEDLGIGKELIEKGIRERFSVACMKKILRPDMTVIDIGANIGFYAFIEASRVKHVHAVEPVEYNFNLLEKNIVLNRFKNIFTYRLAIGGTTGITKIYTSNRCNWATIVDERHRTPDYAERWDRFKKGSEVVPICKLDEFVDRYQITKVDLLRMDVEGAEVEIIGGAAQTIKSMPKGSYLVIEIHSSCIKIKESIENMLDKIFGAGFKCVKVVNRLTEINIDKVTNIRDFLTYKVGCPQVFFKKC
jgi:FkbM family methyltransferase